jgi:CRISPR/Cas system-associated protein Cas5 (RAMP superfamily)
MFKRLTLLICIALLLTACYKYNAPEKPENLISKGKMANILIDLKLIRSINGNNKRILDSNNVKPAQYVYKKYNVDSLQFALSNNYYAFYVDDYEEIYIKMYDSLESLKEKFTLLKQEEANAKRIADSLADVEKVRKEKKIKDSLNNLEIEDKGLIKPVSSGK